MDGNTCEEMGEEFQGTMEQYERYLICREQALMELPADATREEIEDRIADFQSEYDLVHEPEMSSRRLDQPKSLKRSGPRRSARRR